MPSALLGVSVNIAAINALLEVWFKGMEHKNLMIAIVKQNNKFGRNAE